MTGSVETLSLRLLGADFTIRCLAAEWKEFLSQLWEPFSNGGSGRANDIEIEAGPTGWTIRFFDEWGVLDSDPWSLANELRNALFTRALETSSDTIAIHAAALSRGKTGLLLCGPSGTGKSSLTLALLDQGWTYLSDDFAPVSVESGRILPIPKPLHVKNPALWQGLLERWKRPEWVPLPTLSCLIPATVWRVMEEPVEARLIAFPRYDPLAAPSVTRVSAAEATARCGANLHGLSSVDRRALGIVSRLGAGARSAALIYGSSAQALEMVERLFAEEASIE